MTSPLLPTGIIPPLVTPLSIDQSLDAEAYARIVERVIEGGAAGLFLLGTTGEGPTVSHAVRKEAIFVGTQAAVGRVPVLVGITDSSLAEALSMAEVAAEAEATAVVASTPFYFPVGEAELVRFFRTLATRSPLPLILYNMPSCTGTSIPLSVIEKLRDCPEIIAVKDSSGDLVYFQKLVKIAKQRPDWRVYIGPERLLPEAVALGGDGNICGGGNLDPALFTAMFLAATRSDIPQVEAYRERAVRLGQIYKNRGEVINVARGLKCALSILGVCSDRMAEPFEPCDAAERAKIEQVLAELGMLKEVTVR